MAKEVFGDKLPGSLTVELADSLINVAKTAPEDLDLHDKLVVAKVVDQYASQKNCIECPRLAEEFSFVDSLEYLGAKNWDLNVDRNDFRALYEGSVPQNGLPHQPHTGPFFESSGGTKPPSPNSAAIREIFGECKNPAAEMCLSNTGASFQVGCGGTAVKVSTSEGVSVSYKRNGVTVGGSLGPDG